MRVLIASSASFSERRALTVLLARVGRRTNWTPLPPFGPVDVQRTTPRTEISGAVEESTDMMRANDSTESTQDAVVVKPRDRLSVVEGQEILARIFTEVECLPRDVIVDLSGVSGMSSWGFALVCGLARKLARTDHRLRIAGPTPLVRKYLEMFASPAEPVEFHDTREEALWEASGTPQGDSFKV